MSPPTKFGFLRSRSACPHLPQGRGDLAPSPAQMHGAGARARAVAPGNRTVQRPVDFEHTGTVAIAFERPHVRTRQTMPGDGEERTRREVAEDCTCRRQLIERSHGPAGHDFPAQRAPDEAARGAGGRQAETRGGNRMRWPSPCAQHRRLDLRPVRDDGRHEAPIAVGITAQRSGGLLHGAADGRRGPIVERVRQAHSGFDPVQPVIGQRLRAEEGRLREREGGRTHVVPEAGQRELGGSRATPTTTASIGAVITGATLCGLGTPLRA